MRRWLLTLFAAGSLLVCVAACAAWGRSYWVEDHIVSTTFVPRDDARKTFAERRRVVRSTRGILQFQRVTTGTFATPLPGIFNWFSGSAPTTVGRHVLGFDFRRGTNGFVLIVPYWALVLPALITPAVRLRTLLHQRRRRSAGHCRVCGYDLRATPDRCPECGAFVNAGDHA